MYRQMMASMAALLMLGACAATPQSTTAALKRFPAPTFVDASQSVEPNSPRAEVLRSARALIGVPYRYGGSDLSGMDCSGFTAFAFRKAGIKLPRVSREQFRLGQKVEQWQPGDLLFFRINANRDISHVGLYVGNGQMIHAPSSGKRVREVSVNSPYWRKRLAGAVSYLN